MIARRIPQRPHLSRHAGLLPATLVSHVVAPVIRAAVATMYWSVRSPREVPLEVSDVLIDVARGAFHPTHCPRLVAVPPTSGGARPTALVADRRHGYDRTAARKGHRRGAQSFRRCDIEVLFVDDPSSPALALDFRMQVRLHDDIA